MAGEIRESRPEIETELDRSRPKRLRDRGRDCKRTGSDRNRLGLIPAGRKATSAELLRERTHVTPAEKGDPAGQHPVRFRGRNPAHSAIWTDADPAPMHEDFIYLIYTPAMTNDSTHVPSEVQTPRRNPRPTRPHHSEGTQYLERKNGPDHHFSLARSPIKERDFSPRRREISTNITTNTTTKPTHKI